MLQGGRLSQFEYMTKRGISFQAIMVYQLLAGEVSLVLKKKMDYGGMIYPNGMVLICSVSPDLPGSQNV